MLVNTRGIFRMKLRYHFEDEMFFIIRNAVFRNQREWSESYHKQLYERIAHVARTAVVAREYGIPPVDGVARATERITTGQQITIDGTAGTMRIEAVP
jgi:hypothetical protein